MIQVLQSAAAFVVALGILITFHEFGHFWVARLCNVKILRFSVGFGKPLWKRSFGPDRSEFVIAMLPFGGYVKMLDEREGPVAPQERYRAFNFRPLWQRFAIVAAGPLFNLMFAVLAYWGMFMIGVEGLKPVIGTVDPGSPAAHAGLHEGDRIVSVDGHWTPIWSAVLDESVDRVIQGRKVKVVVADQDGARRTVTVDLTRITIDEIAGGHLLERIGITPKRPVISPVIGKVVASSPAQKAGLHARDLVESVDGVPVSDWSDLVEKIRSSPQQNLVMKIRRDGNTLTVNVTPERVRSEDGKSWIGRIGAAVAASASVKSRFLARQAYAPGGALWQAINKTLEMSGITLRVLGKMIIGEASVKNLSGPISIARYAGESAGVGLSAFLGFLAIVSVSLGVLNLLPIPILDGGHLMYYLIELAKGSPVSDSMQAIGQQVGLAVLLGLMGLAFYNDIIRLIG